MTTFTPLAGLIGGLMIGLAAAAYLLLLGRIAGISGMLETMLRPGTGGSGVALAFIVGLPLGAGAMALLMPGTLSPLDIRGGIGVLVVAGLLVGFGTRLANGCTSGHGVCGLPRLSMRSFAATGIFMAAAAATVFVARHVI
ncbi:MAG: YeeE/YedE family protein [Hyphomicrobiales bacterium]|nr:YeeE/YedE family protein [Hyphomicrobiales bacterium]